MKWKAAFTFALMEARVVIGFKIPSPNLYGFSEGPRPPPYLAIITESDACDSVARLEETVEAIKSAVSTRLVTLVSVRVRKPPQTSEVEHRDVSRHVGSLIRQLMSLSHEFDFYVVVSSDWVDAAVECGAHGVHVKEAHRQRIPDIRAMFARNQSASPPLIGTSAHSTESAVRACRDYSVQYLFVGTCYKTASHPEKQEDELEGPGLPGQVAGLVLSRESRIKTDPVPAIFAIGGINHENCSEPVRLGAHGIAVIRAVMRSPIPSQSAETFVARMKDGEAFTS